MNVVRDLRNTITHLQAQLQQKQKQLISQQQQYQQMLSSIQVENQKLKMLLHGDSLTHKDDDFLKIQDGQSIIAKKQNIGIVSNNQYMELMNENIFLKNQITELSQTYQKQIDQLTYFFEKIKIQSKKSSHGHFIGQISLINNWVKSFMKDHENQKDKYNRKITQYAQTLQLYENKIIQQQQSIKKLKKELKQSQEKLKIVTKIKF